MRWLSKWLDLSLRSKCLFLISFPVAAMAAMAGASYLAEAETHAVSQRLNISLQIGNDIERLLRSEIEASADLRAYLITADEPFAAQTRRALADFDRTWQILSGLTSDQPAERQRMVEIAALERSRAEHIFGNMARLESHDLTEPQLAPSMRAAEADRIALERLLKTMEEANTASLGSYLARAAEFRGHHNVIITICLLVGLTGGILMTLLFAHGITGRIGRLHANFARLTSGGDLMPLPGWDEIGALNIILGVIGRLLHQRRAILESALDGVAEVDAQGYYRWQNKAYTDLVGLSEVYQPPTIQATVPAKERPKIEEAIRTMHLSGKAEITLRIEPPAGPPAEVEMTFLDTPGPPEAGYFLLLRKSGFGILGAHEAIQAKEAAVSANRAKTDFLAKISHDIRTPLNAILGAADLLSQSSLTFDQSGYVHMFQRNCRRLVALINDFLDFSRIEAGAIQIEKIPFRIGEVIDDALATFREDAARKGISLRPDLDPAAPEWLLGDSLRIQQVLVNLLSNALKFTAAGGICVRVQVTDGAIGKQLRCEVEDTGPGIAPEDQEKIFAKFMQLPNQTSGQRGAGLGLAICRDLVELMGGEVGVSSKEGVGSIFHFTLPVEAVQPGAASTIEAGTVSPAAGKLPALANSIRVLVAEDTEDNRLLVEHYLRGEPVELRFAFDGREAADIVERGHKFDLILMDIDMPVMNGYDATKTIRAWETVRGLPATPIVALSADAMSEAVRSSLEAGCVAHVAKPVDRGTLMKTIQQYANVRGSLPPKEALQSPTATGPAGVSEQVQALVPHYLATKQKQIEEARSSLASGDFGPIRRFGHNLKGTGGGYGFPAIEQMGREIEQAAVEADADRIANQLDALHRFVTASATAEPVS
jgi:CheY-like chemotaxis protein/nitrogen-specific signal transduction histidine kinase/CHASE3 domain sensor protein